MLFHVGALWRLAELGLLPQLQRVSSVSGGSIVAGLLGLRWSALAFDANGVPQRFGELFVEPLRRLATHTIDSQSMWTGALWFGSIADRVAKSYRKHLYHDATLQDLPDRPRFVLNATSAQSGVLWRFSRPYMADYRVGQVDTPKVSLAVAVAASSAFPPFLSPLKLKLDPKQVRDDPGTDLHRPPFTNQAVLTDGGVYDNLGLETAWKRYRTILVSDGGGAIGSEGKPKRNWPLHTYRVLNLIDNQVRSLRRRQLIGSYRCPPEDQNYRKGAYWGIRTNIAKYGLENSLPALYPRTLALAETPTRLQAMSHELQMRLINWGYAVCDAAVRAYAVPGVTQLPTWPYPEAKP
jgi:NTE family protein